MKIKHIVALTALFVGSAQAAVTLTISAVTGGTNGVLTGLAAGDGSLNQNLVWGILVDTTGNGVLGNSYDGFSIAANSSVVLTSNGAATDDVLFIGSGLMVNTNNATLDGGTLASGNLARPTTLTGLTYGPANGVSLGDAFYIMWMDKTAFGTEMVGGDKYGLFRIPEFTIPADGSTVSFQSFFVGEDPVRPMGFTIIPEPSAALLGALGALGLLRRRRI
jgi:hypothetical protein